MTRCKHGGYGKVEQEATVPYARGLPETPQKNYLMRPSAGSDFGRSWGSLPPRSAPGK